MTRLPSFGVLLGRLLDHRNVDVGALSQAAAVSESELQGVLDGAEPSPSLLRRLAVALNLHAADLFVMAGLAVPDDLAPLDPQANAWVARLVTCTVRLPAEQRRRVRQFVRSMPQQERPQPASPASADQWPPAGLWRHVDANAVQPKSADEKGWCHMAPDRHASVRVHGSCGGP